MFKRLTFFVVLAFVAIAANGEVQPAISLWPEGTPGALGSSPDDIPTVTPYVPEAGTATGAAMIICPGGGYSRLAEHEGDGYARWLNENGVTAFVLRYRLGSHGYHHPAMLQDAARAVRYVRANASKWKVDPKRVGVIGSSAGGHLAATLLTHFDAGKPDAKDPVERESSRPDIGILCYAVITMESNTHGGSKENLLGKNPPPSLVAQLSNEKQVTNETPPCFIWHTWEDKTVKVENALEFASALRAHGVPFDLHIYEKGGHGMGLGSRDYNPATRHPWTRDCIHWLRLHGFVNQDGPTARSSDR